MPPKLLSVVVLGEASARDEIWVELKGDSFKGQGFVAPKDKSFEEWARNKARGATKGKADRLVPFDPPSMVFGNDAKAIEGLKAPGANLTFLKLDVAAGATQVGDITIARKPPKTAQEPQNMQQAQERCHKATFDTLPKKIAWKWEDLWIDSGSEPPKDAEFAYSDEGHAAALVGGKDVYFYDDEWIDAQSNEAAKAQGVGLLGLSGYNVRNLMPAARPHWLGQMPPGMRPPRG